ncbi:ankyrin repeats (3 copies) domain-containing protein [Cordyceps javanica]|nr:ankyrin repeats (3 copies) domain-containing protein [Cordyceps javanica]
MGAKDGNEEMLTAGQGDNFSSQGRPKREDYDKFLVTTLFGTEFQTAVGLEIAIQPEQFQRAARLGGLLNIDNTMYGITAAHVFHDDLPEESTNLSFRLDEADEPAFLTEQQFEAQESETSGSVHTESAPAPVMTGENKNTISYFYPMHPPSSEALNFSLDKPIVGHLTELSRPELDYALLEIDAMRSKYDSNLFSVYTSGELTTVVPKRWSRNLPALGSAVIVKSGSSARFDACTLCSPALLRIPYSSRLSKVWTLSGIETRKGISGSWAFSWPGVAWLGMVVAGCPALKTAYIIPAPDLVHDIAGRASRRTRLLPVGKHDAYRVAIITGNAVDVAQFARSGPHGDPFYDKTETPVCRSVRMGNDSAVRSLITRGANVNIGETVTTTTPVFLASEHQHIEVLKVLLENYGGLITQDRHQLIVTPLYLAVETENLSMAELLLASGANVNLGKSVLDTSAVFLAAERQHVEMLKLLLPWGGEAYTGQRERSQTPLWLAIANNNVAMTSCLLNHGARLDGIFVSRHTSAASAAAIAGSAEVLQILEAAEADSPHRVPEKSESAEEILFPFSSSGERMAREESEITDLIKKRRDLDAQKAKFDDAAAGTGTSAESSATNKGKDKEHEQGSGHG